MKMVEFINKFIKDEFNNYLVIMDNGGAHKSHLIKEAIINSNNKLIYSIPYRPKTNAIESWFNQFKHYFQIQDGGISYNELKTNVRKTIKKISKSSYYNYMKYAYVDKEIRKFIPKKSTIRKLTKTYKK
jgi:transposase InsO family protein